MSKEKLPRVKLPERFRKSLGVKLPPGNPTLVAKNVESAKLPDRVRSLYLLIARKKEGVPLAAVTKGSPHRRWSVRILLTLKGITVVPEQTKKEKK